MKLSAVDMSIMSRLLDEALPLGPSERRAWLDRLPEEYHSLSAALRAALLPEASGADALSALPDLGPEPFGSDLQAGMRIGPYELLHPLGVGGMAEVWLVRRADGAFKREVALKLPRLLQLREELTQRFSHECDILAGLEHPLIARLYDAGSAEGGRPYLAMEYVRGEVLTSWCDRQRLGVRARLELFLQILEAVEFAHGRHVIHRDIKPSNILVTDSGQVRLLDFGIAKLLTDESGPSVQLAGLYGRALTPDYASPELLRGDAIDVRSDIYSLGMLLYELISGGLPYRLNQAAAIGLLTQAAVCVAPVRPSERIEPKAAVTLATGHSRLQRVLRGDLDAITLKALAKNRQHRYGSAAAMTEELRRYLTGRPVEARPPRLIHRLWKVARLIGPRVRERPEPLRSPESPARMAGQRRLLYVAIAAAVLALGYFVFEQPRGPGPHVSGDASIAVLPLANESGDASQQYFSDGLSEDLITALSQFPGLEVIGRTSSFQFRDSKEDSRSIGAKLGVAHLLEGSVRRSGDVVRVSAELIDTADGSTRWSERYDRPYKDLFALQDEITGAVARALRAKLLPGEHAAEQSERPPGQSLEAYNDLLQGRFHDSRNTEADERKAIEYYTQATQLDPRYARAWSSLSGAWTSLAALFLTGAPAQEAYAKAREAANRAVALAPELAATHVARGFLLWYADFDWRGAQAEYRRAMALAPNDAGAKFWLGNQLASFGELGPAIEVTRQVLATEPLWADVYNWLALYLLGQNRLDDAERAIRRAIEIQPGAVWFHETLTIIEVQRGNPQGALAAAQQEPPGFWQDSALALARQIGSDRSAADAALRSLVEKDGKLAFYQIAEVYALRNDANQTFEWLDRAWRNHDTGVPLLLFDPFIARYKQDPRFAAFCREVGLPTPAEVGNQT